MKNPGGQNIESLELRLKFKRCFDVFFSFTVLIFLIPIMTVIAILILVTDGKPVFFIQKRPGLKGKPFSMIKFRTMGFKKDGSQYITRIGKILRKTSFDEFPEFFNVLLGDMSVIGPRPLLMEYLPFYSDFQMQRHDMKPGVSGYAQISGRNDLSWERRFYKDIVYNKKWNIFWDMKIIFQTVLKTLRTDGVNTTMKVADYKFSRPIYVIGSGGHSKVVMDVIKSCGFKIAGLIDDDPLTHGSFVNGIEVKGDLSFLIKKCQITPCYGVVAIGNGEVRKKVADKLFSIPRMKFDWMSFVHPSANIAPSVRLGEGAVVMAGVSINANASVGNHCILNTNSSIDHDCIIGNFSHVCPGSNLAGSVKIGAFTTIGTGSKIIPGVRIKDQVFLGAGCVVIKDLSISGTYKGIPAELIKEFNIIEPNIKDERVMENDLKEEIKIQMADADITQADKDAVMEVLDSKRLALGPKTLEFEKEFSKYIGLKHAIAVSSGTTALHLILKAMGIGEGDEVLVPSFTFVASVNAILYVGATPVFVDIEPRTYTICPDDIKSKITKKTKGIVVVDVFGHPAKWDEINQIAKKHELKTIDDSCEALGSIYKGKKVGNHADACTYAFYPNKQITTGEGGIILTDSDEIAESARMNRNHGRASMGKWLEHVELGYNYRLNEMSAALGVSQLSRIEEFVEKRANVAKWYNEHFENFSWVKTQVIENDVRMSWFVYVITLHEGFHRDEIMDELAKVNIPSRAYFEPIHSQPYLKKFMDTEGLDLPITDEISKRTIALPFHVNMKENEVAYVAEKLIRILNSKSKELNLEENSDWKKSA